MLIAGQLQIQLPKVIERAAVFHYDMHTRSAVKAERVLRNSSTTITIKLLSDTEE